jgi:hypothetical protein
MNWRRVCIFVLIFFAATAVAAFPFGFARGFSIARGLALPTWLSIGQAISVFVAGVLVMAALVRRQRQGAWMHAWATGLSAWLVSYPINVLMLHTSLRMWLMQLPVVCLMVLLGVLLGLKLTPKASASVNIPNANA